MLLPPFTVARNVSTLKGCFTTRHPVPGCRLAFYSEQSVRKTRIISLFREAAEGRLTTVNVRYAAKASADAYGGDL
jgi:hypothetical protein